MLEQLKLKFPQVESTCLDYATERLFYIQDRKSACCIAHYDINKPYHVTVKNGSNETHIYFLAIDHCLFGDNDPSRCDALLFSNRLICFIEIKKANFRSGKGQRQDAKDQLEASIRYFKQQFDLSELQIRAYMCVGKFQPRPAISATDIKERLRFANLGVELWRDGNIIEFDI